jgi:hypothetical protein
MEQSSIWFSFMLDYRRKIYSLSKKKKGGIAGEIAITGDYNLFELLSAYVEIFFQKPICVVFQPQDSQIGALPRPLIMRAHFNSPQGSPT